MATMKHRLDVLARRIPPASTREERIRAEIRLMSSGERRKRIAELTLKGQLGRQPTVDELNDFVSHGGGCLGPISREQMAFYAQRAEALDLPNAAATFRRLTATEQCDRGKASE